jgi:hypothetical protein
MPNAEDKEDQNEFMRGILSILSNSQPGAGDARAACVAVRAPGCPRHWPLTHSALRTRLWRSRWRSRWDSSAWGASGTQAPIQGLAVRARRRKRPANLPSRQKLVWSCPSRAPCARMGPITDAAALQTSATRADQAAVVRPSRPSRPSPVFRCQVPSLRPHSPPAGGFS